MSRIALVIPTIREKQITEFLQAWSSEILKNNVKTYIVEDNAQKEFSLKDFEESLGIIHLSHADASEELKSVISLKSPGCRQIGFFEAFKSDHEILITLDDDVRPIPESRFFENYYSILTKGIPEWVDPLLNYRSRGYPVENTGHIKIDFHIGSFMGVPDVDGETQLAEEDNFSSKPPEYQSKAILVPEGQFIPVNGGICGWRMELTPFIHYAIWSEELSYKRFDDIWMGVILKLWLDACGLKMSYGPPFVNHIRASDPLKNRELEQNGKIWNEVFWQILKNKFYEFRNISEKDKEKNLEYIIRSLESIDNAWSQAEAKALRKWNNILQSNEIKI